LKQATECTRNARIRKPGFDRRARAGYGAPVTATDRTTNNNVAEPRATSAQETTMTTLQDFSIDAIQDGDDLIPNLKNNVVLAVNVASKCGLTPHYAGLEKLYEEHRDQGLTVVGFPCNQFGGQEPGTEEEIVEFCSTNYAVQFPLTTKIDVNGNDRHPIYQWLTSDENGFPGDIEWNFEKFLIDRNGKIVRRYPPATTPEDSGLLQDIADNL
jgi:glutathione peroxidase